MALNWGSLGDPLFLPVSTVGPHPGLSIAHCIVRDPSKHTKDKMQVVTLGVPRDPQARGQNFEWP